MFGLQFIAVNFLYLLFSFIVGIVTYAILSKRDKFTKLKRFGIGVGTFLVVLLLPFWDLLLQKGIKTYYETFMMESQIYAYPEKDKDGKIESLGLIEADGYPVDYVKSIENKTDLRMVDYYKKYVANYVEINTWELTVDKTKLQSDPNYYLYLYKPVRITLNTQIQCKFIQKQEKLARYRIIKTPLQKELFGLCDKQKYIFQDAKTHKILAIAWQIVFSSPDDNFRNKYLLWIGPSGVQFGIYPIGNFQEISQKNFGFKIW